MRARYVSLGLEELQFVGGDLDIHSNANLTSISALENIRSLGGSLQIGPENFELESLSGLENLQSIGGGVDGGGLEVSSNDSLNSLLG